MQKVDNGSGVKQVNKQYCLSTHKVFVNSRSSCLETVVGCRMNIFCYMACPESSEAHRQVLVAGISITSTAMVFETKGHSITLLDTPGELASVTDMFAASLTAGSSAIADLCSCWHFRSGWFSPRVNFPVQPCCFLRCSFALLLGFVIHLTRLILHGF